MPDWKYWPPISATPPVSPPIKLAALYFTDAVNRRIYRWNDTDKKADVLAETTGQPQPQVMGFVKPATLLIAAFAPGARQVGGIYRLDINGGQLQPVSEIAEPKPGTSLLLPVGLHNRMDIMHEYMEHRGYRYRQGSNTSIISTVTNEHRGFFYVTNSNVALMAGGTGRPIMQSSQMIVVEPGQSFFMTSEDDCRTWTATLDKDLKLTAKLFTDRGGNSVVTDAEGNVYIADGNVSVYDKSGRQIGMLETPERTSSLTFGGSDRKTLFIGAAHRCIQSRRLPREFEALKGPRCRMIRHDDRSTRGVTQI